MLDILSITFPIFAIIALGYLTVVRGMFERAHMAILSNYVINIALPPLLFGAIARRDIAEVFDFSYVAVFATGGVITMLAAYGFMRLTDSDRMRAAASGLSSTGPNSVFIGYPLMLLVLPDKAPVILALNVLVENFVFVPMGLALYELSRPAGDGEAHLGKTLKRMGLSILKRPLMIGLLLGMAVMLLGLQMPAMVYRMTDLIGASAAALALFVIGGSLVGLPMEGNRSAAIKITAIKLLVMPALVAAMALILPVPLSPEMRLGAILSAAMPTFVLAAIIAGDYGKEGLASLAVLYTAIGAFFSLSLLMLILGV